MATNPGANSGAKTGASARDGQPETGAEPTGVSEAEARYVVPGESHPVKKNAGEASAPDAPLAERHDITFALGIMSLLGYAFLRAAAHRRVRKSASA